MQATFVLVHGACHGGWCWKHVAARLTRAGHIVFAPDLPGLGDDDTPHDRCTFENYLARITCAVDLAEEPVILVGHSMAGTFISHVAERRAEKIAQLVYLTALVPTDGLSTLQVMVTANPRENPLSAFADWTPEVMRLHEGALPFFYHDCSPDDLAFARARLRPQPLQPATAPLHLTERFDRVPRAYLLCEQDRVLPLQYQQQFAAACSRTISLPSGHSPFFACPDLLATQLRALAHTAQLTHTSV